MDKVVNLIHAKLRKNQILTFKLCTLRIKSLIIKLLGRESWCGSLRVAARVVKANHDSFNV